MFSLISLMTAVLLLPLCWGTTDEPYTDEPYTEVTPSPDYSQFIFEYNDQEVDYDLYKILSSSGDSSNKVPSTVHGCYAALLGLMLQHFYLQI